MIPVQRDLTQTRATLQNWLRTHYPVGRNMTVGQLHTFAQGFSGELYSFDLTYQKGHADHSESLVVRMEPTKHYQLFLDTNFKAQYRVSEALWQHTSTPVPRPIGFEADPDVLGARFYIMEKYPGNTGQLGLDWMNALNPGQLNDTWWNGLAAMAQLHQADPARLGLDFLDLPARGTDPIDQQLHYYAEYYHWVRGDEPHPVVETAHDWLRHNKPATLPPTGIVWGDAKRGNQLFTDNLRCSAILDFEMVSLGPAEADLAWWLEGEYQTAEVFSNHPQPTIEETTTRYSQLLGRDITDLNYYMVFASYRLAILRIKLHYLRNDTPQRGGAHAGDKRLAHVLSTWAGISE